MVDNVTRGRNTTLQKVALAFGLVFALVGVLGFIPGITTNYGDMDFAGHEGGSALLLGVFAVSILHNLVHLLYGVAGVVMSKTFDGARTYLIGGGALYLILWLYGLVVDHDSSANFVPFNGADNWLHLFLGLAMVLAGVVLSRRRGGLVGGVGGRDYDRDIL